MVKLNLHWQILIALGLGTVAGLMVGPETSGTVPPVLVKMFGFLGAIFLRALKMIIVPLIASSIITGVAGVSSSDSIGRISFKTMTYYVVTSLIAIITGLVFVNLVAPGLVDGMPAKDILGLEGDPAALGAGIAGRSAGSLIDIVFRMIPDNPIRAAADGDILPIIVFCLLFGYVSAKIGGKSGQFLADLWQAIFDVMMKLTHLVMRLAPIGVFGLIAKTVASTGFHAFRPLLWYAFTVFCALATHFLVTLPVLLKLAGKVKPARHYRAMAPALLTAFSTSSSSATLPLTMDCVENGAGVSNKISSFVLPLGATVNMDGTALYECVAAMFIAQAYGVHLDAGQQFIVVVTALLASIGAAGIPSAGLVMLAVVLNAVGLPLEGAGIVLAVDRILDMSRTAVNVFSDSCGAVIIARSEGETTLLDDAH
ncbi:MAG: dicarboxylate/amino acid:cation symporter [Candidatus Hydrogenedentes bacterium]|nr:dicarboxylate/amino acid:cation symporter [Candidatus Hydrogenedentota bacterium]